METSKYVQSCDALDVLESPDQLMLLIDPFSCSVRGISANTLDLKWKNVLNELVFMVDDRWKVQKIKYSLMDPFYMRLFCTVSGQFTRDGRESKHWSQMDLMRVPDNKHLRNYLKHTLCSRLNASSLVSMIHNVDPTDDLLFDMFFVLQIHRCLAPIRPRSESVYVLNVSKPGK